MAKESDPCQSKHDEFQTASGLASIANAELVRAQNEGTIDEDVINELQKKYKLLRKAELEAHRAYIECDEQKNSGNYDLSNLRISTDL